MNTLELADDFIVYCEKVRGFSPATLRTYKYILYTYVDSITNVEVQSLTLMQVDRYIAEYSTLHNLAPGSINTVRCVIRAFFLYVDRYRNIRLQFDSSFIRQIKAPRKRVDYVKEEEILEIVSKLKSAQDKLMCITMFSTAMRVGELVRLSAEDISETDILVRGKGQKERIIPIDSTLYHLLRAHMAANNIKEGPIFCHNAIPYTVSGFRKRLHRQLDPHHLFKKPHAYRHGMATLLLKGGMDLMSLMTFLGHSHLATTQIYLHITNAELHQSFIKATPARHLNFSRMLDI